MIVTETLVFVKDGTVIEYNDIIDYLDEFRAHREYVRLQKSIYDISIYNDELLFLEAKVKYLKFMLAKKRADNEIDEFLQEFDSKTKSRLERTLLRDLSNESIKKTQALVEETKKNIISENKIKDSLVISHESLLSSLAKRPKTAKTRATDLFRGEEKEIDGIEVFLPEDEEDETLDD